MKIFAQHAHESGLSPRKWSTTRKSPLASRDRPHGERAVAPLELALHGFPLFLFGIGWSSAGC
jgi:hypothetical protein